MAQAELATPQKAVFLHLSRTTALRRCVRRFAKGRGLAGFQLMACPKLSSGIPEDSKVRGLAGSGSAPSVTRTVLKAYRLASASFPESGVFGVLMVLTVVYTVPFMN